MASDEIVWDIINNQFCSYKIKTTKEQSFCRNEFNVSGYCSKQHCPLANSQYATIRSDPMTGRMYLYMKSIERAHKPNRWWERVRLPSDYNKALEAIDERLIYWPKFLVHKCKQRLTRLTQVAIRTRRLQKQEQRLGERLLPRAAPKLRSREATRERKAEAVAKLEKTIELELIERLRSGAYGDRPLNVEESIWKKVLQGLERSGVGVKDEELMDEETGDVYEWEMEYEVETAAVSVDYVNVDEMSEFGDENLSDLEDWLGDESARGSDSESEALSELGFKQKDVTGVEIVSSASKRRGLGTQQPPVRKRVQGGSKRQIEYEIERAEPDVAQLVLK